MIVTVALIFIKIILFIVLNISSTNGQTTPTSTTSTTTTTVNVVFPHPGIPNDVEISEEEYKAFTGFTGDIDYDSDNSSHHNFYGKDNLFKWNYGIIPYEFHRSKSFDQEYRNRITDAIEKINSNLIGCVLFR